MRSFCLLALLTLGSLSACDPSVTNADAASTDAAPPDARASDASAVDAPTPDGTATDSTATDGTATDSTATDGTATDGTADVSAADVPAATGYFPAGAPWMVDVSRAAVDSESAAVIPWLDGQGFGLGRMQIDFSIEVLEADAATPLRTFTRTGDFFTPDCDFAPIPVPVGGALEGETGYACLGDGDCHLLVMHRPTRRLYEMWRANITAAGFNGGCLAVWDTARVPPPNGRGEQCTSADAAGLPIAPLLFSADEVAAGSIDHAIRFILPNARIRARTYVHPATHATGATTGPATAPPYGARLRLRADYPLASLPNEGARVVARALQRYGMILADGGNVALTAQSDRFTRAKWMGLLGSRDLQTIRPSDFAMVDGGTRFRFTGDCVRNP